MSFWFMNFGIFVNAIDENLVIPAIAGNDGKVLGLTSGALAWTTVASVPGGNDKSIQYNASGQFAGSDYFQYDPAQLEVSLAFTIIAASGLVVTEDYGTSSYLENDVVSYAIYAWKTGRYYCVTAATGGITVGLDGNLLMLDFTASTDCDGYRILRTVNGTLSGGHDITGMGSGTVHLDDDGSIWTGATSVTPGIKSGNVRFYPGRQVIDNSGNSTCASKIIYDNLDVSKPVQIFENPTGTDTVIQYTFNNVVKGQCRIDSSGNMVFSSVGVQAFGYATDLSTAVDVHIGADSSFTASGLFVDKNTRYVGRGMVTPVYGFDNVGDINTTGVFRSNGVAQNVQSFGLTVGNGTDVITTGSKGYITIPYACTITAWYIVADAATGTCTIDLKRAGNSIVGSGNPPLLNNAQRANAAANSSWTSKVIAAHDEIEFNITTATLFKKINLMIETTRT